MLMIIVWSKEIPQNHSKLVLVYDVFMPFYLEICMGVCYSPSLGNAASHSSVLLLGLPWDYFS